jgi:predicted nuclease of predicted toxin-antitoxin system
MRLLADLCIARSTILALRAEGHDVSSLAEQKLNPSDRDVLALALSEGRVVLTEDADFGTLVFREGLASAGVLRVEQLTPADQLDLASRALALHETALMRGAVVTARRARIRVTERG